MQQASTLPSRGCALSTAIMLALASALAWSAGRMSSSRPHGNWDVPSADVAASGHPLRSVGERSDDNARAHHAGLAAEVAAADLREVPDIPSPTPHQCNAAAVRSAVSGLGVEQLQRQSSASSAACMLCPCVVRALLRSSNVSCFSSPLRIRARTERSSTGPFTRSVGLLC